MSDDILNENLDDEEPIEEGDVVIDDSIVVEGDSRYLPDDGGGGGDLSNAYQTTDSAETDIADGDYFPFYDTSASEKKKSLWSNIIAKIKAALAAVATSGSYNDLSNKPTIPSVVNNLTSDSTTDALSAAQGKALATGSARDSTKLPLAGGTMTGEVKWTDSAVRLLRNVAGTASTLGQAYLMVGNNTAQGTAGNSKGFVRIYSPKSTAVQLEAIDDNTSTIYNAKFQAKTGTVALTSDFKAGRGIYVGGDGGTQIFIKPWGSSQLPAVNANAATYFRYIAGFCMAYQTVFYVDRTSVVTPINITVDGTLYRYAPLFSLTAEQASSLLYSASDLPASGAEVSLTRIVNALNGTSSSRLRLAKSGSTYYLIDDALRSTTTNSNTGINNVLSQGKRNYNMPGVLYFLYNIT